MQGRLPPEPRAAICTTGMSRRPLDALRVDAARAGAPSPGFPGPAVALGRRFGSPALLCAPSQGVLHPPSIDRRATMALAAPRDCIARQYCDGLVDLFTLGLPALGAAFSLRAEAVDMAAVQQASLRLPGGFSVSHIVRKHGGAAAQIVMTAAQAWLARAGHDGGFDAEPEFAAWDTRLKAERINPGTTADLTVATLLMAGLTGRF